MESLSRTEILKELYGLKKNYQKNKFPPNFNDDLQLYSEYEIPRHIGFNCYAYAMQFSEIFHDYEYPWYNPGFLSGSTPEHYYKESLIGAFISDCIFLNILCEEADIKNKLEDNTYRVGIFIESDPTVLNPDFHFIRQNDDLSWSEKNGWNGPVNRLKTPFNNEFYSLVKIMKLSKNKQ